MNLSSLLMDLIFPKFCVDCGTWGVYLCKQCYAKLPISDFPLCPGCMKKCATLSVHERCQGKTHLDGLLVLTKFEGSMKTLITDCKYSYYFDEMQTISAILGYFLIRMNLLQITHHTILVPVPLHREKLFERGFNQSELLTIQLAQLLKASYSRSLLQKTKKTVSQAGLDRKSRLKNVQGIFRATSSLTRSDTLILVDDVVTTGSTLSECAKTLKDAGAGKVYGLAVAHGH